MTHNQLDSHLSAKALEFGINHFVYDCPVSSWREKCLDDDDTPVRNLSYFGLSNKVFKYGF